MVDGLIVPQRANPTDAGFDVTATSDPKITGEQVTAGEHFQRILYVEYETNLYFVPQPQLDDTTNWVRFHTDLRPRSSVSKYNLVLANSIGLIDVGYHDQILVRFKYIWQPEDYIITKHQTLLGKPNTNLIYKKGDKICQILPMISHDIKFELVNELTGDDRGGGFGSTDKPK